MTESSRLETLRRRVDSDPASSAFAALAEEYRRARRLDDAIDTARKGLARHPTYVSARVTLGRALLEARRYDAAADELEAALQAAPENLVAMRALAEAHRARGAHARALDVLRRAVASFPQDRELALMLGGVEATVARQAPVVAATPTPAAAPDRPSGVARAPAGNLSEAETAKQRVVESLERLLFAIVRERSRRAHAAPGSLTC